MRKIKSGDFRADAPAFRIAPDQQGRPDQVLSRLQPLHKALIPRERFPP
ncbi:hypothetical protein [Dokdonella sp.]|nr:hypothetical protein [Dokdonella sp.]MBX3690746.1 hypothetical protein [Dokdonella sp.]MCW5568206.1 hypothetical protein [Dokdonella sp.]